MFYFGGKRGEPRGARRGSQGLSPRRTRLEHNTSGRDLPVRPPPQPAGTSLPLPNPLGSSRSEQQGPGGGCGGAEHPLPAPAPAQGTDTAQGSPPPRQGGGASLQDGVVYRGQLYLQEQLRGGQGGCGLLPICSGIGGECKHGQGNGTGTSLPPHCRGSRRAPGGLGILEGVGVPLGFGILGGFGIPEGLGSWVGLGPQRGLGPWSGLESQRGLGSWMGLGSQRSLGPRWGLETPRGPPVPPPPRWQWQQRGG